MRENIPFSRQNYIDSLSIYSGGIASRVSRGFEDSIQIRAGGGGSVYHYGYKNIDPKLFRLTRYGLVHDAMILNYNINTDNHILCPIVSCIKIFYL